MFITDVKNVESKLKNYLLNKEHPAGSSKAEWFRKKLGVTPDNAEVLIPQIIFDIDKAAKTQNTPFGTKYEQIIEIIGIERQKVPVLFVWIVDSTNTARLITAVPQKGK